MKSHNHKTTSQFFGRNQELRDNNNINAGNNKLFVGRRQQQQHHHHHHHSASEEEIEGEINQEIEEEIEEEVLTIPLKLQINLGSQVIQVNGAVYKTTKQTKDQVTIQWFDPSQDTIITRSQAATLFSQFPKYGGICTRYMSRMQATYAYLSSKNAKQAFLKRQCSSVVIPLSKTLNLYAKLSWSGGRRPHNDNNVISIHFADRMVADSRKVGYKLLTLLTPKGIDGKKTGLTVLCGCHQSNVIQDNASIKQPDVGNFM